MGHLRGGLAHVNILSSILFAGLSGSAVADTSALGSMLIPAMEKEGYTRRFAAAITAASFGHRPDHPALGHHDHLCLCDGRKRRRAVSRRHRARHSGRRRPDDHGPADGRPLRPAHGQARGDHRRQTISPLEYWFSLRAGAAEPAACCWRPSCRLARLPTGTAKWLVVSRAACWPRMSIADGPAPRGQRRFPHRLQDAPSCRCRPRSSSWAASWRASSPRPRPPPSPSPMR